MLEGRLGGGKWEGRVKKGGGGGGEHKEEVV